MAKQRNPWVPDTTAGGILSHGLSQDVGLAKQVSHDLEAPKREVGRLIPSSVKDWWKTQSKQDVHLLGDVGHFFVGGKDTETDPSKGKTGASQATTAAQQQVLAMQGAVSGALNNVMQGLFPNDTMSTYNQSVAQGLNTMRDSESNPMLASIASSNPATQGILNSVQAKSGGNPATDINAMAGIANNEAQTNALFEQHLPGLLQQSGADFLSSTYTGALANALKYEQIYQAGIQLPEVPKALQFLAQGASGQAALTTGAGSILAGNSSASGPGGNQSANPATTPNVYNTNAGTTPPA